MSSRRNEIILQGFNYTIGSATKPWFDVMKDKVEKISSLGATIVWFPPICESKDGGQPGYNPTRWFVVESKIGGEEMLKETIKAFKLTNIRCMADIVINHRSGYHSADVFVDPPMSPNCIVEDDDYRGGSRSHQQEEEWRGQRCAGFNDSRDLNFQSEETRRLVKEFLDFHKKLGFECWRYDMVSGYHPSHIDEFNGHSQPYFSVGEYWNDDKQAVIDWINGTSSNWHFSSCAFDFPLPSMLIKAVAGEYYLLNAFGKLNGVVGYWPLKAVTFIENHDTYENREGRYAQAYPWNKTMQGYAYILTHPGTPSIFWCDVFDTGNDDNFNLIAKLVKIRQQNGIHAESNVFIERADSFYAAYVSGSEGTIAVKLGPELWSPSRYNLAQKNPVIYGDDWAVWSV